MVKRCCYGTCNTDTRYKERLIGDVQFHPFPKPPRNLEKCRRWIELCGRPHAQINEQILSEHSKAKHFYVCSKHFVDGKPTKENPDPKPALTFDKSIQIRQLHKSRPLSEPLKKRRYLKCHIESEVSYNEQHPGKRASSALSDSSHESEYGISDMSGASVSLDSSRGERFRRSERADQKVPNIHAIRGLPINVPFILDFTSPSSQSAYKSEPYILLKYSSVCELLPEKPFKVTVKENIVEVDEGADTDDILYNLTMTNSVNTMISSEIDSKNVIQNDTISKSCVNLPDRRDTITNQPLESHTQSKEAFTSELPGAVPENSSDILDIHRPIKVEIDNSEDYGCNTDSFGLREHDSEATVRESSDKESKKFVVIRVKKEPEGDEKHVQIVDEFIVQRNEQSDFTHSNKKAKLDDSVT